ncbi:MAG: hypothetical protein H6670_10715 [Anaerolineaceae bacterium]|nr:hypothetical protein [Anaerolineaceae bacterium]
MDNSWIHKSTERFTTWQDSQVLFPEFQVDNGENIIVLLGSTNNDNERIYCYLKIQIITYLHIQQLMKTGQGFAPRDFGEVVAAGIGRPTKTEQREISARNGTTRISIKGYETS